MFYTDRLQQIHEKSEDTPVSWRISGYGILENAKREILMVEPAWTSRLDLPGGGIHVGERISDGVRREFYEETGYRVEGTPLPFSLFENDFYNLVNGEFEHVIGMTYRVTLLNEQRDAHVVNTFEDGFEIRNMRWVDPALIAEDEIQPCHWAAIQNWLKIRG